MPGYEAPVLLAYSARNRSASCRIPYGAGAKAKRVEFRFPDAMANPYLCYAALLMAGLDVIKNKIHPGEAMDKNLYDLPPAELKGIPTVCGSLREALASLYGLFATTRESLKASRPSVAHAASGHTVEYLAITMLNYELRPFLSKWHPLLRDFEQEHPGTAESQWPHNAACRAELDNVRSNIVNYALGFGRLAGVYGAESMFSDRVSHAISST